MVLTRISLSVLLFSVFPTAYSYWVFGGAVPLVTTRLDSIVSPGEVSSHVHTVLGGSRFGANYDFNDLTRSECSTILVQSDKSNYWAPQLYYLDQAAGTYTPIPTFFNIYYLPRPGPKNEQIHAFPNGLRMLAGDVLRRVNNATNYADKAISYYCLDNQNDHFGDPSWDERADFFEHQCPNAMRAQIFFPSCWDGVNLDSPDHKSHMAYPLQDYNTGDCPDTHPVHLISLFYEMIVRVDLFPYVPGSWVYSFGDTTGLGLHADFQDGWEDKSLLQNAIDQCAEVNGDVTACAPLNAAINNAAAAACKPEMSIPNENVGFTSPLTKLPGCNLLWSGTGPKPVCDPNPPTPSFAPTRSTLPSGWTELGCIVEGTTGRAFTSASTTDPAMTKTLCANYCGNLNFPFAGVEYGDECYCGSEFSNGAVNQTVPWSDCSVTCAGNPNENCGGSNRLSFLYNPTKH